MMSVDTNCRMHSQLVVQLIGGAIKNEEQSIEVREGEGEENNR